jgi:hypothetical protein
MYLLSISSKNTLLANIAEWSLGRFWLYVVLECPFSSTYIKTYYTLAHLDSYHMQKKNSDVMIYILGQICFLQAVGFILQQLIISMIIYNLAKS